MFVKFYNVINKVWGYVHWDRYLYFFKLLSSFKTFTNLPVKTVLYLYIKHHINSLFLTFNLKKFANWNITQIQMYLVYENIL